MKKGKERIIFLYYSTSKTYTNRSFPGTVNASDPIISTGLSESILKKQTDKQMLLFKGRAIAANKNCKKILMVSNVCISLCLACKIPRGIEEVVHVRTDNTIFRHSPIFLLSSNFGSSDSIQELWEAYLWPAVWIAVRFLKKRIQPIETALIRFKVEPVALWYWQQ